MINVGSHDTSKILLPLLSSLLTANIKCLKRLPYIAAFEQFALFSKTYVRPFFTNKVWSRWHQYLDLFTLTPWVNVGFLAASLPAG